MRYVNQNVKFVLDVDDIIAGIKRNHEDFCSLIKESSFKYKISFVSIYNFVPINFIHFLKLFADVLVFSKFGRDVLHLLVRNILNLINLFPQFVHLKPIEHEASANQYAYDENVDKRLLFGYNNVNALIG